MRLPISRRGCFRSGLPSIVPTPIMSGVSASGDVINSSSQQIWITAGNRKHCLAPRESSDSAGIDDADGLLLDGRSVLFDSLRTDLGGGQIHSQGAIKVCSLGTLTVTDAPTINHELVATVSTAGFVCPGESAGYKSTAWCEQHGGWDFNTAPVARPCQ
ncbi:hypothetical protein Q31b_33840 [Novipirellula aureliae]|uniref:Uncharacterized protein n=1 Tax=Novipirellula aureliae TaxID=2527966 RepID=A0A5C6DTI4_9BACT|nr:hypothetical protein Q31b_33840 [Novipirellula aureliae]